MIIISSLFSFFVALSISWAMIGSIVRQCTVPAVSTGTQSLYRSNSLFLIRFFMRIAHLLICSFTHIAYSYTLLFRRHCSFVRIALSLFCTFTYISRILRIVPLHNTHIMQIARILTIVYCTSLASYASCITTIARIAYHPQAWRDVVSRKEVWSFNKINFNYKCCTVFRFHFFYTNNQISIQYLI